MLRPIVGFAAVGLGGLLALKVFLMLVPIVGVFIGLVLFGFKLLIIGGLIYVAYRLLQKAMKPRLQME